MLLVLVGTLLCAGVYALVGKPTSHEGKKRKQDLCNGFQTGGGILLSIALMAGMIGGSQIGFGIVQATALVRAGAFLIVVASLAVIFSLIHRWAKHFPGWIGYSVWNGLSMISSGHLLNHPSILVPRWYSISMTVSAFVSAVACLRFTKKYVLNGPDKIALMSWVIAFTFAADVDSTRLLHREELGLTAVVLACAALVAAWWHQRATHRHRPHMAQMHHSAQQGNA